MGDIPVVTISRVGEHVGQTVQVNGWVYNRTDKGRLQFILLRDGSGTMQSVAFKKDLSAAAFDAAATVTQESSVSAVGIVRADASGRIVDFEEKPAQAQSNLASMGVYVFKRRLAVVAEEGEEEDEAGEDDDDEDEYDDDGTIRINVPPGGRR